MATVQAFWKLEQLRLPHEDHRIQTLAARNIPYVANANARQNLNVYLPANESTHHLINQAFEALPEIQDASVLPRWHVHIHGGAWRDPNLRSSSIEADVALAFSNKDPQIDGIVSIDYTLSPFPAHPTSPYDPLKGNHGDPSREAKHPQHVSDVLNAFQFLRSTGFKDESYILTGHSAGACLAFQSSLLPPTQSGLDIVRPPRPAALVGLNGLYDLPDLVHKLGDSHQHLSSVYKELLGHAFGSDETKWPAASPARVDSAWLEDRVGSGQAPSLVLIDQSAEDQLVPMSQADKMESALKGLRSLQVVRGNRCKGAHAVPWEDGEMIWHTVQDVLILLQNKN